MNEDLVIENEYFLCKNGYFLTKETLLPHDNVLATIKEVVRELGEDYEWHYATTSEPQHKGICCTLDSAIDKLSELVGF